MFHASVTILAASAPWELRVLALKRRYTHMRAWDPAEDSIEQTVLNDLGTAEEVAWDQWRSQLINEGGEHRGAEGDMEKPPRPASHLQGDAGAHGAQRVRQVPDENRTRDDGYLSPLRGGQGHGAAHAGVLSGAGAVPLHPAARHRREIDPFGDRRSDAERDTGI